MKVVCAILASVAFCSLFFAGCSPKASDSIVLEVGLTKIPLSEYENFFMKNSGGWELARQSTPEERERFLDLLTNYKLKLQDAYERGLINDSDIIAELRDYRTSLAQTFLVDRELTEPGVRHLYDRKLEEIRARHILVKVGNWNSPDDTLAMYTKAADLIRRLKVGTNFDSLAITFSDDPSAKTNRGDIYYFSGGQMVGPFENAVFMLKKGETSPAPIRTPFGYHVVRVDDRRVARWSMKGRHIMARFSSMSPDSADTANALARIRAWQDSLKHGADFAALATKYSEDAGSQPQGGDLGWFERRRWVQPFDEAAFNLGAGQLSGIVRSPYGYHILRCDSIKPPPPYAEVRDDLKRQYQQNRFAEDYQAYIGKLKHEYRYSFDEDAFDNLLAQLDSTKLTGDSAWDASMSSDVRRLTLMTVNSRIISIDTVLKVIDAKQELHNAGLRRSTLRTQVDRIAEGFLLDARAVGLENRYPEFASLMKDYNDGIILYKAEQMEVWNKTTVTDTALRSYFAQNASRFMTPERVNIAELHFDSDTLALIVYDSLLKGADFSELATRYNHESDLKSKNGVHGLQPVTKDELTQATTLLAVGQISEPLESGAGYSIIKLLERELPRQKTFEEAGAEVSNAFQDAESKRLEKEWLDRIKLRYPVKQYKEPLKEAFAEPQASR